MAVMQSLLALPFVLALASLRAHAVSPAPTPNAPWNTLSGLDLEFVDSLSDEFDAASIDTNKWSFNGIENPDTGCPRWNGPPNWNHPNYAVYFTTETDLEAGTPQSFKPFSLSGGMLELYLKRQSPSYFTAREYYCNSTTYTCNHNPSIPCFPTKFNGEPNYKNGVPGTYWGVVHDKCKIEPYCIPSPEHVTRQNPIYRHFAGPHITSRERLQYGFVEARVVVPDSSAVLAVWMHSDQYANGYCRYRKAPTDRWNVRECPSAIRSRRWGEIDILEAINSASLSQKYVPNLHVFSDNKGEFSAASATDGGGGEMGGGPIILLKNEFNLANPDLSGVSEADRKANDWHYNPGSVEPLDEPWAARPRTVGVYWSPSEIRWYLDGKEVRRIKNRIVHIPMNIDLSYAFNVNWAGENPVEPHNAVAKIDYVRVWKVGTADGSDVPATNSWLDMKMHNAFEPGASTYDHYGNQLGGVAGVFPQNDPWTVVPPSQTSRFALRNMTAAPAPHDLFLVQLTDRRRRRRGRGRRRGKPFRQAGGPGNRNKLRRARKSSKIELTRKFADRGRVAEVAYPGAPPKTLADPGHAVQDDGDASLVQAGWATKNGDGKDITSRVKGRNRREANLEIRE